MTPLLPGWAVAGIWLSAAAADGPAEQPPPDTGIVAAVENAEAGAWRDFKADFLQGMFAAEEEVALRRPTWWIVVIAGTPAAAPEEAALPAHVEEWPAGDEIEQMHVLARVRGHNWAMWEYVKLKQESRLPAVFEATDPTREEMAAEESAARQEARSRKVTLEKVPTP
jgi:hypothetical protein